MKALVTCEESSNIKFEDFTFDLSPSLFLHSREIDMVSEILNADEYEKEWEKYSINYEVHKSQVIHQELIQRGILDNQSDYMEDFTSNDLIITPKEFLNHIYIKFEVLIF